MKENNSFQAGGKNIFEPFNFQFRWIKRTIIFFFWGGGGRSRVKSRKCVNFTLTIFIHICPLLTFLSCMQCIWRFQSCVNHDIVSLHCDHEINETIKCIIKNIKTLVFILASIKNLDHHEHLFLDFIFIRNDSAGKFAVFYITIFWPI